MSDYVVIGGPLASGKTTLAWHLAGQTGAKLLAERFSDHPIIEDFYMDPKRYALQAEMIFTIMHYHDIAKATKDGDFNGAVVSDLFFDGVEAYTGYTLAPGDRDPFMKLFRPLQARAPVPSIVVYLDASTEFLMDRVKWRGRKYEMPITFEYLDGVNTAFKEFIKTYRRAPTITVDAEKLYAMGAEHAAKVLDDIISERAIRLKQQD
ncbi:MAG: deoxynucleoside kinase [Nitrososphaerota archaeon]|nr:deoxynucleoside kinase [Nitrososphaerota archaeon]